MALVGTWARTTVLDADDGVRTVAPLATDQRVQAAVGDRVADDVVAALPLDDEVGWLPGSLGEDTAAGVERGVGAAALVVDHVAAGLVTATWWVGGAGLVVLLAAAVADAPAGRARPRDVRGC